METVQSLSKEMVEKARRMMQQVLSPDGRRSKVNPSFEIVPPPRSEGETIIGAMSGEEFRAIVVDGVLQWRATGRNAVSE